jgi:ribonucleotide reductase alpha subunit
MYVIKRSGKHEPVSFDKVLHRIQRLARGLEHVDAALVAQKVCSQIQNGISTAQLDEFAAETCAMMQARNHPNYGKLAARIAVDNHHKTTPATLAESTELLSHILNPEVAALLPTMQEYIDYERDFMFDYFGFKTLERAYLLKKDGIVVERPQHMWMRVAVEIHRDDLARVRETYDALSHGYFIHATPTLFNAGTTHPQLSSCFLLTVEDSIEGIYDTLKECALISKWAGGIGLSVHNIRAKSSTIRGTNGKSTGLVPMLKVFNHTAKYVNQGGKRNGSFAIYLEPWHADVEEFLRLKLNTGIEDERARDLFYALWIPDLFMKRVEAQGTWTLMCPDECPGLADCWGEEFEALYTKYEAEGRGRKSIPAQKLWQMILDAQIQTGTPYLCYKDAANRKSNQQHLGTIKSSNLCVAPETYLTVRNEKGSFGSTSIRISELEGKEVEVWNGDQWSRTTVHKTGTNQKLLRVTVDIVGEYFTRRQTIYCTEYHKFLLPTQTGHIKDCVRVDAHELKPGTVLQGWRNLNCDQWISQKVVSVEFDGRYDDTYCFNEPINHAGVFNDILTGQCSEIVEFTSPEETAVCNLGSLALPQYVREDGTYDYESLRKYTRILARNLDIVIDRNFYPSEKCSRSNFRHRPIGIGVQGLADVFAKMRVPWSSPEAARINREIFENIYFAAVEESLALAKEKGRFSSFEGSPTSEGKLQFHLWQEEPKYATYLPWKEVVQEMQTHGLRNSLLIAPMPTASTSQILGNNECFEPFTTNLYVRHVLAGDFMVINKYLVEDLMRIGIWNAETRTSIIAENGSIQNIPGIPPELKELYKTAWEIPQKTLITLARDRAPFICQSQSLNLFAGDPSYARISSMHFYAWKQGLKTGCYYLRTRPVATAQKFTVEPTAAAPSKPEDCLMCSS